MDEFENPTPEHFLFGTVRIRVSCRRTGRPLDGVLIRVAGSHEAALGRQ
jgi:hypothetical protein